MINRKMLLKYADIMKKRVTYIDSNIELRVTYDFEQMESQIEECHGQHEVGRMIYIELTDVKLMIDDLEDGLSVLALLTKKQIKIIVNKIQEQHQNN
jgi:hypothetical protein